MRVVVPTLAFCLASPLLFAQQVYVTVNIGGNDYQISSDATADWRDSSMSSDPYMFLAMSHDISGPKSVHSTASGYGYVTNHTGVDNFSYQFDRLPAGCYRATVEANAQKDNQTWGSQGAGSSNQCVQPEPPPNDPPLDNYGGCDWQTGCSPIVVNFEAGDYRLTGANSPVLFDIGGSGSPRAHRLDRGRR
jgi:hypothetical protein